MSSTLTPTPAPTPAPTATTPTLPAALTEVEVILAAVAAAGSGWTEVANLMHNAQASADVSIALAVVAALLIVVRNITSASTPTS
jgi:hypothetical protein